MKNILSIILIIALILISFLLLLKVNSDYQKIQELKEEQLKRDKEYLENLSKAVEQINKIQAELEAAYEKIKLINTEKDVWEEFEVTGYSADDPLQGTTNITAIGINLNKDWIKYFSFCAVDPELIPMGSIVAVKFEDGDIKYYLAVDTGETIKGKHIDILFENKEEALGFGKRMLDVKILK